MIPFAGENSDWIAQCQAWTDVINVYFVRARDLLSLQSPASAFYEIMRQRCAREPLIGICDTAFVVPCPDVGRTIHKSLFKALWKRRSSSETARDIFELSVEMMEDFLLILSPAQTYTSEPRHLRHRPDEEKIVTDGKKDAKADGLLKPSAQHTKPGVWPDVSKVTANFKSRVSKALNPLATDCRTANGLPKYRSQTKPDRSPPPSSSTTDTVEQEFLALLNEYIASGKKQIEKKAMERINTKS